MNLVWICVISAIIGGCTVGYFARYILKQSPGTERIRELSSAIQEGAMAFIRREYRTEIIVVVIVAVILGLLGLATPDLGWKASVCFIFGAICSLGAGYIGMNVSVRSNGRTTTAVQKSLNQGLRIAFRSGAVMGLTVVSIGLVGLSIVYFVFHNDPYFLATIPAYATGASLVALFARLGGGIFTKGADAGSDLVGKVEAGIPEDDPRNAGVIADFVGDNVGDVCGVGADLFETYVEAIIAVITLSALAVGIGIVTNAQTAWYLPMLISAGGIIAAVIGSFMVRVGEKAEVGVLSRALRNATWVATALSAVFSFLIIYFLHADLGIFWALLAGLIVAVIIGEATNYYTSADFKPTKEISQASAIGGGATMVRGFAVGLMSNWPVVLATAVAIVIAFKFASFYGVAITAVGMLSTLGITLACDSYGPVADNAGGIATMARLPVEIRDKTDALGSDLVGKVEAGIPEDDPRNAGVIADFVGDNVGDVCGVGADLFESYVEAIIAAITLSALAVGIGIVTNAKTAWYLPMLISAGGIIASVIGSLMVRVGEKAEIAALSRALRNATWACDCIICRVFFPDCILSAR